MKRGVDFDGTLATYHGWLGPTVLGGPIQLMVDRVKKWIENGDETVILTARVYPEDDPNSQLAIEAIKQWCVEVFGQPLEVTCRKDPEMEEIWDDRAVSIRENTGEIIFPDVDDPLDEEEPVDSIGEFFGG